MLHQVPYLTFVSVISDESLHELRVLKRIVSNKYKCVSVRLCGRQSILMIPHNEKFEKLQEIYEKHIFHVHD
jgi:hypothetical protein